MLKRVLFIVYFILVVVLGIATFIDRYVSNQFVKETIYGSWWFCLLWGILVCTAIIYFFQRRIRRLSIILLHCSFIVILFGALQTHLFGEQGVLHLRINEPVDTYIVNESSFHSVEKKLPFIILLKSFRITYHQGTEAPQDYISEIQVTDKNGQQNVVISMNKIYSFHSVRLYQSSYDEDGQGSYLAVNVDPLGITVTYFGYALLFLSLIWILCDPKGTYRRLLKSPLLKRGMLAVLFFCFALNMQAANVLPREVAKQFSELNILYNNRICPLQTYAIDFTKKLYHEALYKGYTAEQVLTGFLFYQSYWDNQPIIRVKDMSMRKKLSLPEYTSFRSFFKDGNYILGEFLQDYYRGNKDSFHKAVAETDEKLELIFSLRRGSALQIYPYTLDGQTTWYASDSKKPTGINQADQFLMENILKVFKEDVSNENIDHFLLLLSKVKEFQIKHGGSSLPNAMKIKAEYLYNAFPFAKALFMVNLTMGFLTLFYFIFRLSKKGAILPHRSKNALTISLLILIISFLVLTYCGILRWIISGEIPMKNGYETMLLLAWFIMLITFIVYKKFPIVLTFGFLLSGFFLLVAYIGQMDPQITPMMPVLASPLLSIHVSMIMMSFALLSLTFLCAVMGLLFRLQGEALQLLSRLFLYPAVSLLGIGIFIGAIWANVSWGNYWGWDPKEVWALITFMVYAIAMHTTTLPKLNKPSAYHVFMLLAFLTVLMTYFGVNYLLGGMHSYA
ncbi:cytochrome c biogenesis protein CcsA [Phocaeicola oris]|uniref:cytochrome c biogenesis protein CcsA n=1 Tax=Phocaeicola oris TaxID=2896850 RepID=UPI00234F73CF|nr:cytochrome c biogenesis protein CcsA [Phocaeicola oris]MCE2616743.1 cytochrome c biogenesis protein CcsA [Phocaeicola oris]